jgi:hypothetical protein
MLERAYNQRDSTYWLLGLYIESDLQIINGVHRRKKPWRSRFNDAAWRVERALVRIYGSAPEVAER